MMKKMIIRKKGKEKREENAESRKWGERNCRTSNSGSNQNKESR